MDRRLRPAVLGLALLLAACGSPSPSGAGPGPSGSAGPTSAAPSSRPGQGVTDGVSRAMAIADPAVGLENLPAYRATLTVSFSGTQAGKPSSWSQKYALTSVRDARTRILAYEETGLGGAATYPALEGFANGARYLKETADAACTAAFAESADDPAALPEPARLLPKVRTMTASGGTQQVAGVAADPFSFDAAAVVTGDSARASGSVLLASDTRALLKYDLGLTGGHDVFDADTEGTMSWAYTMEPIDPAASSALPDDCPTPLPDVPIMSDAANVQRFPGYVGYETPGSVAAAAAFYRKAMSDAGFTVEGDSYVGAIGTSLGYLKGGESVQVAIAAGAPTTVRISRRAPKGAPNPTPIPVPTPATLAGQMRVVKALTLLLGSDTAPSTFPSYHLEQKQSGPYWNDRKVAVAKSSVSADVEGKNVHFTSRETKGGTKTSSEVYRMGDKEYEVVKGKLREGGGLASLGWLMWPLDAMVALGIGSFRTTSAGTETLDGRTAEVYRVAGTVADDKTGMFAGFGFPITSTTGTVWVDQATGALLKTVLDYRTDVKDTSAKVRGSGTGHLEIVASRIGRAPVSLP